MKTNNWFTQRVKRFLKRDNGTQLVELAIALPLFVVLIAGTAEFGRFFYTYSTLTNAVRGGARHASRWQRDSSWTFPETARMVVYGDFSDTSNGPILPGLTTGKVRVQANGPSAEKIDSVTVRIVDYPYVPLFDLGQLTGNPSLSMSVNLNASATMHQLFNGPVAE